MEVTLGSIQAIPEGEGRSFVVGERRLAVFRTRQGRVFATQADCPHRRGPLADGLVGGDTLICPLHSLKFDLASGRSADESCTLAVYPVRLSSGGQIVVELDG
ncbi:MAG TPA: Rieske 2Fe-2S domain-containing protein [Polyangiaceae bacterium]